MCAGWGGASGTFSGLNRVQVGLNIIGIRVHVGEVELIDGSLAADQFFDESEDQSGSMFIFIFELLPPCACGRGSLFPFEFFGF